VLALAAFRTSAFLGEVVALFQFGDFFFELHGEIIGEARPPATHANEWGLLDEVVSATTNSLDLIQYSELVVVNTSGGPPSAKCAEGWGTRFLVVLDP